MKGVISYGVGQTWGMHDRLGGCSKSMSNHLRTYFDVVSIKVYIIIYIYNIYIVVHILWIFNPANKSSNPFLVNDLKLQN